MNIYLANLLHAVVTMACSIFIYIKTEDKLSLYMLVVSVILLALNNGVQNGILPQIKAALSVAWLGMLMLVKPIEIAFVNGNMTNIIMLTPLFLSLIVMTIYGLKAMIK